LITRCCAGVAAEPEAHAREHDDSNVMPAQHRVINGGPRHKLEPLV
jgi:hypothetical protein